MSAMDPHPLDWIDADLAARDAAGRRRRLRPSRPLPGGYLERDGRRLLDLSSNDYLGLARCPDLAAEIQAEAQRRELLPTGATASRLIVGDHPLYTELEREIADLKSAEAAVVFTSGYAANVGVIPAIVGRGDAVFSDRLNHASIVDGIVLSRAKLQRYRHGDTEHLAELLARSDARRKLIVTDSVFSMDGDTAPLAELVALKQRYGAMLMLDEAHGGGVFGHQGAGWASACGLADQIDLQMGTLSKSYASQGGYVAGSRKLIEFLHNTARSLIYSTGVSSLTILAALIALRRSRQDDWRRQRVLAHASRFRQALQAAGLSAGLDRSQTPIIPLILGADTTALAWSQRLETAGIAAVAIRPPTVPDGSARIRFSLSAAHSPDSIDQALRTLASLATSPESPPS